MRHRKLKSDCSYIEKFKGFTVNDALLNFCKFVKEYDYSNDNITNLESIEDIVTCNPKYSEYVTRSERVNSFEVWRLKNRTPHFLKLAKCGFFYINILDFVKCFHCGLCLFNWHEEDDPWIEHARFQTSCEFLIRKKGSKFISRVQDAEHNRSDLADDNSKSGVLKKG